MTKLAFILKTRHKELNNQLICLHFIQKYVEALSLVYIKSWSLAKRRVFKISAPLDSFPIRSQATLDIGLLLFSPLIIILKEVL